MFNMFKIGDIIKGLKGNQYLFTSGNMTKGIVTRLIPEDDEMEVEILEHTFRDDLIGEKYVVNNSTDEFDYYFSKNDIQNGDIVYLRNGNVKIYFADDNMFYAYKNTEDYDDTDNLDDLNDDLTHKHDIDYDIIKVVRPKEYDELFKREEVKPKEMTLKEVCDILGYDIKIKKED